MALAQRLDLGAGHTAEMVWREGADQRTAIPVGLVERHTSAFGICEAYVGWAISDPGITVEQDLWTLVSLAPLSIEPAVSCPDCGTIGRIEDGRWQVRRLRTGGSA